MALLGEDFHEEADTLLAERFSKVSITGLTETDYAIRHALENVCREVDIDEPEMITEEHPLFEPARRFWTEWKLGPEEWNNFVQLARGFSHFPMILLQNPAPSHWEPFEKMRQCPTISWLSKELDNIGLSLNLVPVFDVCSFFSDQDLKKMNVDKRWEPVEASYQLLGEILDKLRPNLKVVVCCQCATRGRFNYDKVIWKAAKNPLASQLCSSVQNARAGLALPIYLDGSRMPIGLDRYTVWGVQAFHPRYTNFDPTSENGILLRQILERVFHPCVIWYQKFLISCIQEFVDDLEEMAPDRLRATREMYESGLLDPDEAKAMNTLARKYFANWQSIFWSLCDSYGNPEDEDIRRLTIRFDEVVKKTKEKVNGPMTNTTGWVKFLRDIHST